MVGKWIQGRSGKHTEKKCFPLIAYQSTHEPIYERCFEHGRPMWLQGVVENNHSSPAFLCMSISVNAVTPPPYWVMCPANLENKRVPALEQGLQNFHCVRKNVACQWTSTSSGMAFAWIKKTSIQVSDGIFRFFAGLQSSLGFSKWSALSSLFECKILEVEQSNRHWGASFSDSNNLELEDALEELAHGNGTWSSLDEMLVPQSYHMIQQ